MLHSFPIFRLIHLFCIPLCMVGDLCSDYPLAGGLLHHILTCTVKEMASLMTSMRKDIQTACIQNELWKEETSHIRNTNVANLRCHGDVCDCSVYHMDGEIFLHQGKRKRIHVCWWWRRIEGSHWTKQLTEREWRRPLTWLDRFRDAVLLPASWGDEDFQPHVGNKCLKLFFLHLTNIFCDWTLWIK